MAAVEEDAERELRAALAWPDPLQGGMAYTRAYAALEADDLCTARRAALFSALVRHCFAPELLRARYDH